MRPKVNPKEERPTIRKLKKANKKKPKAGKKISRSDLVRTFLGVLCALVMGGRKVVRADHAPESSRVGDRRIHVWGKAARTNIATRNQVD